MVRFSYLEFILIITNLGAMFTLYDQNEKLNAQMNFVKTQNDQIRDLQRTLLELKVDLAKMHGISNSSNSNVGTGKGAIQSILDFTANNSKTLLIILVILTLMYITYGVYSKIYCFGNLIPSVKIPTVLSSLFTKDSEQIFWAGKFKFQVLMDQGKVSSIKVMHQDELVMRPIEQALTESYIKIDDLTRSLRQALNTSMDVTSHYGGTLSLISEIDETTPPLKLDQVQEIASQIITNCGGSPFM